jgi:hypothetical protein
MLLGIGYPTGKKTHAGAGMGKNLYSHAGMGFLSGRVRVGGCGYGTALPDGILPVAISISWLLLAEVSRASRQASARCTPPNAGGRRSLSTGDLARPTLHEARQGCADGCMAHAATGGKGVHAYTTSSGCSSIHGSFLCFRC